MSQEEADKLIDTEPKAKKYIKRFMMGNEFLNDIPRYCLWLVGISPKELRSMPLVLKHVEKCRENRLSGAADRQKLAATPHLFRETRNPDNFIAIPVVSSERRAYIPMDYLSSDVIAGNKLFILPDATKYDFGILESIVHM
ncbi:methylase, partial [Limosilactobacillus mucosae]|nr:methylase [Limosilactobacillus mucosae]